MLDDRPTPGRGRPRPRAAAVSPDDPASSSSARAPPAPRRACCTSTGRRRSSSGCRPTSSAGHERHPDVGAAAPVLDRRVQHRDGRHAGRRRLLGHAGDLRAGDALRLLAREHVTEPYTLPHQAAGPVRSIPTGPPPTSPRCARCTASPSSPATPRSTATRRWNMPVGLRPVGDVRLLRHPPVGHLARRSEGQHGPAPAGQRGCGSSTPTPGPCSAPTRTASSPSTGRP